MNDTIKLETDGHIDKMMYDDITMNSNIISGEEYKKMVCTIARVAADMVRKTLGPYGATTVIDDGSGFTYPSKDGWTCLTKLQFTNSTYNTIYNMLKKISFNSVTTVGDGTTTAMVVASHFLDLLYEENMADIRQADFLEAMKDITNDIITALEKNPIIHRINSETDPEYDSIYRIAYIATNGNEHISGIIRDIYKTTNNPHINVEIANIPNTVADIQRGYKFDARVLNHPAYANTEDGTISNVKKPRQVFIFDHNVNFQTHQTIMMMISTLAKRDECEIVIMSPYFDQIIASWVDSAVQTMIHNHQIPNIMLVQIPITMELHRLTIGDLAVLTNAQVITDVKLQQLNVVFHNATHPDEPMDTSMLFVDGVVPEPEELLRSCMGTMISVQFTKHDGFLSDYDGIVDENLYRNFIMDAKNEYDISREKAAKMVGGTLDKDYLFKQMRYIKLSGNTGLIRVGGVSDLQQRCEKDVIDDAVLACRSAYLHGYVRGLNIEILRILKERLLHAYRTNKEDSQSITILTMLLHAFTRTSMDVLRNKYNDDVKRKVTFNRMEREIYDPNNDLIRSVKFYEPTEYSNIDIINKLIDGTSNYDYNLRTETFNENGRWEVINSSATDIEILKAVVNVLSTIMTSTQFISTTRRFDEKRNNEISLQSKLADEKRYSDVKYQSMAEALENIIAKLLK